MTQPAEQKKLQTPTGTKRKITAAGLILAAVFAVEGGYVNHPGDPGGETNHGITKNVARAAGYAGNMRDLGRYCETETDVCAESILQKNYIEKPGFMPLVIIEPAVAEEVIDTAVNMGPARPSRFFQKAVNDLCNTTLTVDGEIGQQTVEAWFYCEKNLGPAVCRDMLDHLDAQQRAEYDRLVRRNSRLRVFYRGWINHRINNVDRKRCM